MVVSMIIPAFNEAPHIADVLQPVISSGCCDEVIVVDDGSSDGTACVASAFGAHVIRRKYNGGKGAAIDTGLRSARGQVIALLDADLIGLRPDHVERLIMPVTTGNAQMSYGVFQRGRWATDIAQKIAPGLTGQRAFLRDLATMFDNIESTRYGVDIQIHRYAKRSGYKTHAVLLDDLTHHMKEEKLGLFRGFYARIQMYYDIAKVLAAVQIK